MHKLLSKSRFMSGIQCHKRLWYEVNDREAIPPYDEATQAIFEQGHAVGEIAKRLFPGGIEVTPGIFKWERVAAETREAMSARKPLYEAGFVHRGGAARVDILVPAPDGAWDLLEVKSTTEVKPEHELDVAFQAWVVRGEGVRLRSVELVHINNQYTLDGQLDPAGFFTRVPMNDTVERLRPEVEFRLAELQEVAERSGVPVVQIGEQCGKPHDCPLKPICWDFLPDYPVTDLYRNKKLGFELLEQGILRLEDIPAGIQLNGKHHIQRTAAIDGEPQIDRGEVRRFLSEFEYPLQYLDFETVAPAIPLYQGTRPYQQVPFQFSLHIEGSPGAEVEHRGFLAEGREDPRPEFLRSLQDALLDEGSIVVYNAGFEKGILRGLAESFPEGTDWVERLEPRIVDLLIPFRNMWYYHPDQNGSASIKAVLPVLTDLAYDDLDIAEGGTASREFLRITFDDIDPTERARVRKNLEIYCALDTEAMVRIVRELEKMAGGAA